MVVVLFFGVGVFPGPGVPVLILYYALIIEFLFFCIFK